MSVIFWLTAPAVMPSLAQLPATRLTVLFPSGGKAGSTVEVTAQGADFEEPARLQFSHPGITATALEPTRFKVAIASNVPPGEYDARYIGRFGISNPRRFAVGTLPEHIAPPTNTTQAAAFELPLNSTCHGRVAARSYAWFKFAAKKGQRTFVECLAETLDSRMDVTAVISDADGREWERTRTGGVLDFTPSTDGVFFVRLADFLYRGGDDYFYRLTISTGPHVDYILPVAGIAGTKTNFTLYGRALPGGKAVRGQTVDGKPIEQLTVSISLPPAPEERMATRLPASAGLDTIEYRFKGANPVLIAVLNGPGAVLVEQEPNSTTAQAQKISPPCEISGQFHPNADVDRFVFNAKKGDAFWVEVISHRLGQATAPQLLIQRLSKGDQGEEKASDVLELTDNDTNLGEREFNTISRDPSGRFEAKEDGLYRIELRDLFSPTMVNPRNTYHLSIRRGTPDFRLVAQTIAPKYKSDAKNLEFGPPVIRRGESLAIRVMAFRRDGFNGPISLFLDQAPPGLALATDMIEAGRSTDYVLLTAALDAPAYAGPLRLLGRARIDDRDVTRVARGAVMVYPVPNTDTERPESRPVPQFELAVTDQELAPISIAPADNRTWEAPANTKLEVPLTIARRAEFNANLKLKPLGPGTADALKEFEVDGKATNATLKLDLGALKLPPGRHLFAVQAVTTGKYRNNPDAAAFAEAASKEADKNAAAATEAAKKAATDLDNARKAASAADTAAKTASEKLAAVRASIDKEKTATTEKPATEPAPELVAAQKANDAAVAAARTAHDAVTAADKAKTAADNAARETQAKKEAAARRAKETSEKAKARDVNYQVTSAPIVVQINPAPAPAPEKKDKDKEKEKDKKQAGK